MTKDRGLRAKYKFMRCAACAARRCDPAHIRTYGATGIDADWNILPLCRIHHNEQHRIGLASFVEKHPMVRWHLKQLGWDIEVIHGKTVFTHPKLRGFDADH